MLAGLNLSSLLALILANPQAIQSTVAGIVSLFKASTAPHEITVPAVPATGTAPAMPATTKKPSDVVKQLQKLLNQFVKPQPALKEDGWLGEKTEKAIATAITMAQPYLAMLG